jgi:hypothetical protein
MFIASLRLRSSYLALSILCVGIGLAGSALAVCTQPKLFQQGQTKTLAYGLNKVVLIDVNHDGIRDAVVASPPGNAVDVMLGGGSGGVGNGTFGTPVVLPVQTTPEAVIAADFDGDGHVDIIATNLNSNTISFLHGHGDGTFSTQTNFYAGPAPYGLVAADFDGDGILDLAIANNGAAQVSILKGQGSGGVGNGNFGPPSSYPIANLSVDIAAADLNGDGKIDLVATAYSNGIAVLLGNGNGTFQSSIGYSAGAEPFSVAIRDLNGDGIPDIAVANENHGGFAVLKGVGNGTFGAPTIVGGGQLNLGFMSLGDFNGDGITDVACPDALDNAIVVLTGQGSGGVGNGLFAIQSYYTLNGFALGSATADLNGDGVLDLVGTSYGSGALNVLVGGCFSNPPPVGPPFLVSVRDVPNDQGGKVFLRWTRSAYDTASSGNSITGYRVWRRIPPNAIPAATAIRLGPARMTTRRPSAMGVQSTELDYWEAVATLPAEGLAGYGYTAATTQDSIPGSNPFTAFFVTALTSSPTQFYESNVDSGYSVDNLAPASPVPFVAVYGASSNALHWSKSRSTDLLEYRLYRGTTEDFTPGPPNLIAATNDTGTVDAAGAYVYKLAAIDVHGNASHYAVVTPELPVAALASLMTLDATADHIQLTWFSGGSAGTTASVYRRTPTTDWARIAVISADGRDVLTYRDEDIVAGARYGYRLGVMDAGVEQFVGEAWATAERLEFALQGALPNPTRGNQLNVQFVIPTLQDARLELFDMAGRRVVSRQVGSLGPGRHVVNLADGVRLHAGVYMIRYTQGRRSATARAVVLN